MMWAHPPRWDVVWGRHKGTASFSVRASFPPWAGVRGRPRFPNIRFHPRAEGSVCVTELAACYKQCPVKVLHAHSVSHCRLLVPHSFVWLQCVLIVVAFFILVIGDKQLIFFIPLSNLSKSQPSTKPLFGCICSFLCKHLLFAFGFMSQWSNPMKPWVMKGPDSLIH